MTIGRHDDSGQGDPASRRPGAHPHDLPSPGATASADPALGDVAASLRGLEAALAAVPIRLDVPEAVAARTVATELIDQINDYLLPRLARLDAPLLAVLGGSTGSGKSTITNALARADVSKAGVLRPTTRAPVLICHPDDLAWFAGTDLLGGLPRLSGAGEGTGAVLQLRTTPSLEPGVAIIDAPDIDSVELANRDLAAQLLAAADLWLFVTTAVRYADAVPWEFLARARERGMAMAIIINRVPPGAGEEISGHLRQMLDAAGIGDVTLFTITEGDLVEGRLPEEAVADIARLLAELARDGEQRAAIVRATLAGALASVPARTATVIAAAQAQDAMVAELRRAVDTAYANARAALTRDLAGGTLLRSEVLDRWQELIGTGEMMRAIQSRISVIRDRLGAALRGRAAATNDVQGEITSSLERLVLDYADAAALETVEAWRRLPGGDLLLSNDHGLADDGRLGDDRSLERTSEPFRASLAPEIRAWQHDILELVRARGEGKRKTARVLAFGVNSVGVALMIVLFAQTGGITGGEVVVASGTAGLSQALLTALFGEQAVRELAASARTLLHQRLDGLLEGEANRFRQRLWATLPPPEATAALGAAVGDFTAARGTRRRDRRGANGGS